MLASATSCCTPAALHPTLLHPNPHRLPPGTDPRSIDYSVSPARAEPFYAAIRAYLPGLPDGSLEPAYSGVRPKVGWWSRCTRCVAREAGWGGVVCDLSAGHPALVNMRYLSHMLA